MGPSASRDGAWGVPEEPHIQQLSLRLQLRPLCLNVVWPLPPGATLPHRPGRRQGTDCVKNISEIKQTKASLCMNLFTGGLERFFFFFFLKGAEREEEEVR